MLSSSLGVSLNNLMDELIFLMVTKKLYKNYVKTIQTFELRADLLALRLIKTFSPIESKAYTVAELVVNS
jgi:hypothetical protein